MSVAVLAAPHRLGGAPMIGVLASAVLAAAAGDAPAPAAVDEVEIVTRRAMVGELKEGVQAYRPEFFTPVRPANAMDMIKWLPGFSFEDTRDLRGLGGAVGNVLIDGKPPTSKTDTLAVILSRIPPNQVDRVDIIVGGAPGIDMRGRPVVANIVLKQSPKIKSAITSTSSFFQDGAVKPDILLSAARKTPKTSWETSLTLNRRRLISSAYGEGPFTRRDATGRIVSGGPTEILAGQEALIGTGFYEFPALGGRLKLNGSFRTYSTNVDEQAVLVGSGARNTLAGQDFYRQGEFGLRYDRAFGTRTSLEAQFLRRTTDHKQSFVTRRPPVLSDFLEHDDLGETIGRATLRFKRDPKLVLEASAEAVRNTVDTDNIFSVIGAGASPLSAVRVVEDRGEVGALATWTPNSKFGLTTAIRVETSHLTANGPFSTDRTLTFAKPRAIFTWTPLKKLQVRLRAEREVFQIPLGYYFAAYELSGVIRQGNPGDIVPHRDWLTEVVVERQFWTGASIVATLRNADFVDLEDARLAPDGLSTVMGNVGGGGRTDLTATVTLPLARFGLKGVMLKGNANYTWSHLTDPTTGLRREFSYTPRMIWDAHLVHDIPAWKLNWGVDAIYFGSIRLYRPTTVERIGETMRLSVFAERRFGTLAVKVEAAALNSPRPKGIVNVYTGRRDLFPLAYRDERQLQQDTYLNLRIRKTFN